VRKSTAYKWWNFFPIALYLQFKKVVNIFYLVTAILNFIPSIAVNKPAATLVPLSFVILLGIAKEAVAEIKRYRDDKKTNAIKVIRLIDGKKVAGVVCKDDPGFEETCLAELQCGDILKIVDGQEVPADCILLKTNNERAEAFVKTSQLDGERNLKPKLGMREINDDFDTIFKSGSKSHIEI
jgi:phospholipid-translocating ATPase